ncbi:haloacid dehalogenase [Mesobacillus campisalis]|uniref:Haloacid dehalogenase n=1 Tax=Mesobacillus campisalis TaxID=1408103 RepID=A0A0M2SLY5_9BACI|nr:HAD family phosphatase [Mesobacillus campisalis]KKK33620.1 haloacid dehalogenase [Mesobacillus campisalis]
MRVAIFDFDRTLFPEETFPLLMKHLKTHPQKYRSFMSRILPIYAAYKCKLYPEQRMREHSMRSYISAFGKVPETEVNQFFSQLGSMMSEKLSEPMLARLQQHREDGYYIMLVSGAFQPLLNSVAAKLPFDEVIGTNFHKKNLQYINGSRKREVVHERLSHMEVDWENSFAYGDSYTDLNVLELVGNPVAVQPEPRLLEVASRRQWEILA